MRFLWLFLTPFLFIFDLTAQEKSEKNAILIASVYLEPVDVRMKEECLETGIQPGKSLKCLVEIENTGKELSPPGQLFVRYAYAPPLDEKPNSVLYESEKKPLPSIPCGEKVKIAFDKPHLTPTIIDFIHYDWLMREYEAIAVIDDQEKVIGAVSLTFSAYYYPTVKKEYPSELRSGKLEECTPPSF